jgi:hypothetical protein
MLQAMAQLVQLIAAMGWENCSGIQQLAYWACSWAWAALRAAILFSSASTISAGDFVSYMLIVETECL